jgi:hypothetical protein
MGKDLPPITHEHAPKRGPGRPRKNPSPAPVGAEPPPAAPVAPIGVVLDAPPAVVEPTGALLVARVFRALAVGLDAAAEALEQR